METLFSNIDFLDWLILGAVLIIVEIFVCSTFFLWMGISAVIVGIFLKINPELSSNTQLLTFAFLSVSSIYIANPILVLLKVSQRTILKEEKD